MTFRPYLPGSSRRQVDPQREAGRRAPARLPVPANLEDLAFEPVTVSRR